MSSMLLSAAAKTTVSVCVCAMPLVASAALLTFNGCCRSGAVSHSVAAQRGSAQISAQSKDSLTTTATSAAKATLPSLLLRRLAMLVCLLGAYLLCLLCASLLHSGPSSDDFSS